jgi:TPP-dependent pyruvate/acetoin dehydrogenase alpha subunit
MAKLTKQQHLDLYYFLKLTRLLEERMVNLYRQNKIIGGLYRSLGQEATAVGSAYALEPQDIIAPIIRDLGALLIKGVKPREVLCQYMARVDGPTKGKDLNIHFSDLERGFVGPISMLGDMICVMGGVALGAKMRKKDLVALVYIGDGATSTGAFHEGMNFAAVQNLPLIIIAENNAYAYSTPNTKGMRIKDVADRAKAYGIPAEIVDGNDVLAVYDATKKAAARARRGDGPVLIEAKTFRMKGHAEHDNQAYVPKELLEEWKKKDPLDRYEKLLKTKRLATDDDLEKITRRIEAELETDLEFALNSPLPDKSVTYENVYATAKA